MEIYVQLTEAMTSCQSALLDLIDACVKELKRGNITVGHFATNTITLGHLATNNITVGHLATNDITSSMTHVLSQGGCWLLL